MIFLNLLVFLIRLIFYYLPHYFFILPFFRVFFIKNIEGKENIPKNSNFIIAANHQNTLDHWILLWPFRNKITKIHFLGRMNTLSKKILWGWFFFITQTLPINSGKKEREKIISRLVEFVKKGKILVFYPEGNTNKGKFLLKGKTGLAELCLKVKVPVLPVGLSVGKRRKIKIGKPIFFEEEIEKSKNLNQNSEEYQKILEEMTTKIMKEISNLSGQIYPYGD